MGQFTKDLETTNTSVHCSQNFKMLFAKFSLVALAVVPCLMAATIANEAPEAKELEELFAQSRSAYNIDDLMNEIPDEEREAPEMDERKLMGLFASMMNKEGADGEMRDLLAAWNREGAEEPEEEPEEEDEEEDVNGDEDNVDDGLGDDDDDEEDELDEFDPEDVIDEDALEGDDLSQELEDDDDEIPEDLGELFV